MGLKGREFFLSENGFHSQRMADTMVEGMERAFENWKPKERFELYKIK